MEQGYDVKVSEVHGMSQRGGSVVTYVRYGDRVNSPVIDRGAGRLHRLLRAAGGRPVAELLKARWTDRHFHPAD